MGWRKICSIRQDVCDLRWGSSVTSVTVLFYIETFLFLCSNECLFILDMIPHSTL
uniref:Uncharacterized protein n=1 Tax=Anguilla anguilla TaxID=7936 RepID=A0A0E9QV08_ANGAN